MLKFEKINEGKTLRISAINPAEFAEYIKEHEDDMLTAYTPNSDMAFFEMTEAYSTNGWGVFTADQLGQLSECLVVAEESTVEGDGSFSLSGKAWTNIDNYQIENPLDLILENGHVDFYLWEDFKKVENFKASSCYIGDEER
jgi:hypothetical protein